MNSHLPVEIQNMILYRFGGLEHKTAKMIKDRFKELTDDEDEDLMTYVDGIMMLGIAIEGGASPLDIAKIIAFQRRHRYDLDHKYGYISSYGVRRKCSYEITNDRINAVCPFAAEIFGSAYIGTSIWFILCDLAYSHSYPTVFPMHVNYIMRILTLGRSLSHVQWELLSDTILQACNDEVRYLVLDHLREKFNLFSRPEDSELLLHELHVALNMTYAPNEPFDRRLKRVWINRNTT